MNIYFLENFNQIKSLDIIKYDTNRILFDYTLIGNDYYTFKTLLSRQIIKFIF